MRKLLAGALVTLLLIASPAKSQQPTEKVERKVSHGPETVALITSDISNFWRALSCRLCNSQRGVEGSSPICSTIEQNASKI